MNDLTLFEQLALVGLSRPEKKKPGLTSNEILDKNLRNKLGALEADIPTALQVLAERQMAEELPRPPKSRSSRWRLLPNGEKALEALLGGLLLKGNTWKQKAIRVVCVQNELNLAPEVAAKFVERDALTAYYLAKQLGDKFLDDFHPDNTPENIARIVTGLALKAINNKKETLWNGLLRTASENRRVAQPKENTSDNEVAANNPENAPPVSDSSFAEEVLQAARASKEGWFGSDKIFVHRAWGSWKTLTGNNAELRSFKDNLIKALQEGDLSLTRADFTVTLDPEDLRAAEIHYGTEVFHFIIAQRDTSL